ncbi:MAG: DUF5666 domain-containing protein [Streptosporangiaceae bacterium]
MDELKMISDLLTEPPPSEETVARGRARLTAATSAPLAHPGGRRRSTMVAVAAAAALVAAGTGYGLTAARDGSSSPRHTAAARGGPTSQRDTATGLTAVHGCPGMYITAGTLEQVSGMQLIIQPANDQDHVNRTWQARPVTVATSASTAITRPASGAVSDITDGLHVVVQGTWSGGTFAATQVGIEAALPPLSSFGPHIPGHLPATGPFSVGATPPFVNGTVVDAHDGSFTVITQVPPGLRVQVTTSNSTKVVTKASASLSQLSLGANVVAVGPIGPDGVLTASTVTEPSVMEAVLAGGPAKLRPSGCSASAITTAAILAGG